MLSLIKKYFRDFSINEVKHARVLVLALLIPAMYAGFIMDRISAQPAVTQEAPAAETGGESAEAPPAADAAPAAEKTEKEAPKGPAPMSLWQTFVAGGWSMYPLLLASIIGMVFIMERIFYYSVTRVSSKTYQQELADAIASSGLKGIQDHLNATERLEISKILKEGLEVSRNDADNFNRTVEKEAANLITRAERGLGVLAAVSTIAPLIGFLGTVSGMISAFDAIANADTVNAKVVAGGIKEALITTAAGLIVAVPAMTFFQYFSSKVNGYAVSIEQASNSIYKELVRMASAAVKKDTAGV